jgi:hypothetical protein
VGIGEVVGGVALVGVAVLIGLALTEDNSPETLSTSDATLLEPAATTAGAATTTAVAATDTSDAGTEPTASTDEPPATEATASVEDTTAPASSSETPSTTTSGSDVATPPTTTVAPSTTAAPPTTLSLEQKREVDVRVLNGGARAGAAGDLTAALRFAGFTAPAPGDTSTRGAPTTILYAPFQEGAAAAVNVLVGAGPENIREGALDPNWVAYGGGLDVLVVLGAAPG